MRVKQFCLKQRNSKTLETCIIVLISDQSDIPKAAVIHHIFCSASDGYQYDWAVLSRDLFDATVNLQKSLIKRVRSTL